MQLFLKSGEICIGCKKLGNYGASRLHPSLRLQLEKNDLYYIDKRQKLIGLMYKTWPNVQITSEVQGRTEVLLYLDEYPTEKKIVSDQTCLCSGKSGYPAKIHPVDFEKDDDSNFHMDFIVACSNLRLGMSEM